MLDYLNQFINVGHSESLSEAVPELLKNMLLVMSTAGVLKVSLLPRVTHLVLEDCVPRA